MHPLDPDVETHDPHAWMHGGSMEDAMGDVGHASTIQTLTCRLRLTSRYTDDGSWKPVTRVACLLQLPSLPPSSSSSLCGFMRFAYHSTHHTPPTIGRPVLSCMFTISIRDAGNVVIEYTQLPSIRLHTADFLPIVILFQTSLFASLQTPLSALCHLRSTTKVSTSQLA